MTDIPNEAVEAALDAWDAERRRAIGGWPLSAANRAHLEPLVRAALTAALPYLPDRERVLEEALRGLMAVCPLGTAKVAKAFDVAGAALSSPPKAAPATSAAQMIPDPCGLSDVATIRAWLCRKYLTHADARQQEMGIEYLEAEVTDLAKEIASYIVLARPNPAPTPADPGEVTDAEVEAAVEAYFGDDYPRHAAMGETITGTVAAGMRAALLAARRARPAPAPTSIEPAAWIVLLNYGKGKWSGEMLTDVLPSDASRYRIVRALYTHPAPAGDQRLAPSEAQIEHMVTRFLRWKLPDDFNPDDGISFKAAYGEGTAFEGIHIPSGTNLFDATQATAMVRHMIDGLPRTSPASPAHPAAPIVSDPLLSAVHEIIDLCERPIGTGGDTSEDRYEIFSDFGLHVAKTLRTALSQTLSPTHHHKKRGENIVLLNIGKMQAEFRSDADEMWSAEVRLHDGRLQRSPVDNREVAIYRSVDDGKWWVRPREEFEDGRFEVLPAPPAEEGE